jgi:heat shock protein HslJ
MKLKTMDEEYGMKTRRIAMILTICAIIMSACAEIGPADQPDLEETTWELMTYNDNHPIEGAQPTLQFEDGQVSGNASCNHYSGSYQINGDKISFDALFSTEMACMDPEGVMEQERIYLELLGSADRFELSDSEDVLTIYAGPHQILTFEVKNDNPTVSAPTREQSAITPAVMVVEPTLTPTFKSPVGFKEYRDSVIGVSVRKTNMSAVRVAIRKIQSAI